MDTATVTMRLTGTAPLLMHSNMLADPLSPAAKAMKRISAKTKKTDDDHNAMRRIEFDAALYLDPELGPYLPGPNVAKAFLMAARIRKSGPKVERGLILVSEVNSLSYAGPRDVQGLWDANFRQTVPVKIGGRSTVMRCRPMFLNWECTVDALLNPSQLPPDELVSIAEDAGHMIGVGDWRPWHGRFSVAKEG